MQVKARATVESAFVMTSTREMIAFAALTRRSVSTVVKVLSIPLHRVTVAVFVSAKNATAPILKEAQRFRFVFGFVSKTIQFE